MNTKYIVVPQKLVFLSADEEGVKLEEADLKALTDDNITYVSVNNDTNEKYVEREPYRGKETDFDFSIVDNLFIKAERIRNNGRNPLSAIIDIRNRQIARGFIFGEQFYIPCDETTIARLDQAVLDSDKRPDNWFKKWKTASGWITIDKETVEALRNAAADLVEACFRREEELEIELKAADDPYLIDIEAGWPGLSEEDLQNHLNTDEDSPELPDEEDLV